MSRNAVVFTIFVALLLLGLGAWRTVEALGRRSLASEETHAGPAAVEAARVTRRPLRDLVNLSGTLRPVNEVDVASDVAGRVVSVEAEIGDRVEADAVLARLDAGELWAGLKQAKAAVEAAKAAQDSAQRELASSERLFEVQGMSEVQITAVRGRLSAAQAQLAQAEASLVLASERYRDATIRSPIAGVVTDRKVGNGQSVSPGAPLFHVQDTSALELEAQLDERVASRVKPGMTVEVTVRGSGSVPGAVRVVSPSLDPRTRKAKVIVSVPDAPFLPYATAEAHLVLEEREALSVPAAALVHDGGQTLVITVREGKALRVPVLPGISDGAHVEIDALAEGDLVVTSGAATLRDGAPLTPHLPEEAK